LILVDRGWLISVVYHNLLKVNSDLSHYTRINTIMSYHDKKKITCTKCGVTKTTADFYYNRARKRYTETCRQCNSELCLKYQHTKKTDLGFITQRRAAEIRRRCIDDKSNREVADNLKDLLREQWEAQKGLCYYTKVPMTLSNEYHTDSNVMTVDRIDPTKGYVKGNLALCRSVVNRMKQDMTIDQLKAMCQLILTAEA